MDNDGWNARVLDEDGGILMSFMAERCSACWGNGGIGSDGVGRLEAEPRAGIVGFGSTVYRTGGCASCGHRNSWSGGGVQALPELGEEFESLPPTPEPIALVALGSDLADFWIRRNSKSRM